MIRLSAVEYRPALGWLTEAAEKTGAAPDDIRRLVSRSSSRLASLIGSTESPLTLEGDRLDTAGIAGLVRLTAGIELEIAPKFLDPSDRTWREDFFFLANLATSGRILSNEQLSASGAARNDLASIVGRAFVDEYERHARRPLRAYRNRSWGAWELDGEVDEFELVVPSDQGFLQRGVALERRNDHNAVIRAAAVELLPLVADPTVRLQLTRVRDRIGPQEEVRGRPKRKPLPSRQRRWQPLYDLALQILEGLGMDLLPGRLTAPGYVVATWQAWESLVRHALALRYPGSAIYHEKHVLGTRPNGAAVEVEPDVTIHLDQGRKVVIDAKYKGRSDKKTRLVEADLYESLAFMQAANSDLAVLVYPQVPDSTTAADTGATQVFDVVTVPGGRIVGVMAEVRGISARGGYKRFAEGLASQLSSQF